MLFYKLDVFDPGFLFGEIFYLYKGVYLEGASKITFVRGRYVKAVFFGCSFVVGVKVQQNIWRKFLIGATCHLVGFQKFFCCLVRHDSIFQLLQLHLGRPLPFG